MYHNFVFNYSMMLPFKRTQILPDPINITGVMRS